MRITCQQDTLNQGLKMRHSCGTFDAPQDSEQEGGIRRSWIADLEIYRSNQCNGLLSRSRASTPF